MRFSTQEAILPSVKRSGSEYLDILMGKIFLFPAFWKVMCLSAHCL